METSGLRFVEWLQIGVTFLLRLTLVVAIFALAIWLWPPGLLHTAPTQITLEQVVRSVTSATFLFAGITSLYLVWLEPFMGSYVELHGRHHDPR